MSAQVYPNQMGLKIQNQNYGVPPLQVIDTSSENFAKSGHQVNFQGAQIQNMRHSAQINLGNHVDGMDFVQDFK